MSTPQTNPAANLLQPSRPTTATTASSPSASTSYFNLPTKNGGSGMSLSGPSGYPIWIQKESLERTQGPIDNLLAVFSRGGSPVPGTVRIRVQETVFYCHRELLMLASPFFESLLSGDWKENQKRSPVQKPAESIAQVESDTNINTDSLQATHEGKVGVQSIPSTYNDETINNHQYTSTDLETDREADDGMSSPSPLPPSGFDSSEKGEGTHSLSASYLSSPYLDDDEDEDGEEDDLDDDSFVTCRLRLREESASRFQDLLCHLYPRLECLVQWGNVGDLCRMASKFDLPSLRRDCIAFLLPSAAGNPIMGMKIAEDNDIPELYKEASRYTLDNYQHWPQEELALLSESSLLKLERRRSWFLERLLKLGLVQTSRDYACHPACVEPSSCARLVDEKWRSAWSSSFRSGTPQPSIIYRSLRSLEPSLSSPALHLPFTACQTHARLYVADLFDRMFGLSITPARNWGAFSMAGTSASSSGGLRRTFGPSADGIATKILSAKYFLFVEMGDDRVENRRG